MKKSSVVMFQIFHCGQIKCLSLFDEFGNSAADSNKYRYFYNLSV
ncbi:hypothetical protein JCM16774_1214 [Pseudoleptotrichia goodfellowii]|jgi:hypothetical protein|uniref:Uncharacterized protein n=1 Tax=Pseudoleptotrichia goodfellowii TaxID=157692 RepID=A0A510JAG8_9FUSO|nr:hypothetical protein JCM16774_1214 [Pseudoleptotrichia goodfellowii]